MNFDAIAILEAAYDLEASPRAWMSALLALMAPHFDRGFGLAAATFDVENGGGPENLVLWGMNAHVIAALTDAVIAGPSEFRDMHRTNVALATASQSLGLTPAQARRFPLHVRHLHPVGIRDVEGLRVLDPRRRAIVFVAPTPDVCRSARADMAKWSRIAVHLAAADRLREALSRSPGATALDGAEAVLTPSGQIAHAARAARPATARDVLRAAARSIDRARGPARGSEEEALSLWKGLVAGRWSLIDHFDSDGRRYLVACANGPEVRDPRRLSLRERQVVALAALGQPLKIVAYALGLSLATVAHHRAVGMRKLGLRSVAELVQLYAAKSRARRDPASIARPKSSPQKKR